MQFTVSTISGVVTTRWWLDTANQTRQGTVLLIRHLQVFSGPRARRHLQGLGPTPSGTNRHPTEISRATEVQGAAQPAGQAQKKLPATSRVLRGVLVHSPNSAPPERVFSILNDSFDDDQSRSLNDYIQLSMQLQYNERGRSRGA